MSCTLRFQCCSLLLLASATGQEASAIQIDGQFDDWLNIAPILREDPADSPHSLVDFGDLRIAHDQDHLYLAFSTGSMINLQAHRGTIRLLFDADGDESTGRRLGGMRGVDLQLVFSPRSKGSIKPFGQGARLIASDGKRRSPYELGIRQAPTHAARHFELRLDRSAELHAFAGERLAGKMVFTDAMGRTGDETEPFHYRLDQGVGPEWPEQTQDPLTRHGELRVLSWNSKHGGLFARPEPFTRLLRALDPDLLMLQEIEGAEQAHELGPWFAKHLPMTGTWKALVSVDGGTLRSALVSRLPMQAVDLGLELGSDGNQRLVAAVVHDGEKRLLALSLHLRCCGHLDSREDLSRRRAAAQIRAAIAGYLAGHRVDGILLAGDFNLVGSREPLELLGAGTDFEGGDLRIAAPQRLDPSLQATWRGPGTRFLPGRLDYLLHSNGSLRAEAGFVFASEELAAPWRKLHGVDADDSRIASDHLPLVLDFSWR